MSTQNRKNVRVLERQSGGYRLSMVGLTENIGFKSGIKNNGVVHARVEDDDKSRMMWHTWWLMCSVIFVNENKNENGEKWENNEN